MTKNSTDSIWQLYSGSALLWVECGGEYIVFHPDSGETHYLNDFSALVLRFLEDGALATDELCQKAADLLGNDNPGLSAQLHSLMTRFDQVGLVERCDLIGHPG